MILAAARLWRPLRKRRRELQQPQRGQGRSLRDSVHRHSTVRSELPSPRSVDLAFSDIETLGSLLGYGSPDQFELDSHLPANCAHLWQERVGNYNGIPPAGEPRPLARYSRRRFALKICCRGRRAAAAFCDNLTPAMSDNPRDQMAAFHHRHSQSQAAIFAGSRTSPATLSAVVMGIVRCFNASGTSRTRSTCSSPFSRLAALTWTWSAS
jgi:hypothetical protein